ncbi:helix-turn-helix transcriptional regulator [Nereida sp. MMG025]|uniref:helix-turn-helix domain-containing protein n=1 Tax=Nereida sp. MMG025 TaxID=2909981 RepID=UPI001F3588BE|nr:helix-turn-helix transcriptional regulator [Nereida sp. MMG025]MCF6444495.1 helix-turn-helix domain-containing protein [Nereida sp. MMG025]
MENSVQIHGDRLKAIRKGRKIGRPKLAKRVGLTERKLTALETQTLAALPMATVTKLADALQVPEPTLTGDLPVSQDDLTPAAKPTCTSGCCG